MWECGWSQWHLKTTKVLPPPHSLQKAKRVGASSWQLVHNFAWSFCISCKNEVCPATFQQHYFFSKQIVPICANSLISLQPPPTSAFSEGSLSPQEYFFCKGHWHFLNYVVTFRPIHFFRQIKSSLIPELADLGWFVVRTNYKHMNRAILLLTAKTLRDAFWRRYYRK